MSTTRPPLWPLHNQLGINEVTVEQSLYLQNGYPTLLPVPSDDHNGKLHRAGDWHRYIDLNSLRNADWLDTTAGSTYALTSTRLRYGTGGSVITTGQTVSTRAAYLLQGTRIETDATLLNPVGGTVQGDPLIYSGATLPGRIWVYANAEGQARFASVGVGVVDSPNADEITLVGVDVDALGVVTVGDVAPITKPLPARRLYAVIPVVIDEAGTVLEIIGGGTTGGNPAMTLNSGIGPALTVTSATPSDIVARIRNTVASTQPTLTVIGDTVSGALSCEGNTRVAARCTATGSGAGIVVDHSGLGRGIDVNHTGAGAGIDVDTSGGSGSAIVAAGPTGANVIVTTCDTGAALRATVTSSGVGVSALGGPNALSFAVSAESQHVDAFAIRGVTAAAANAASAAILGSGLGSGVAVYANSMAGEGYGLIAAAQVSMPRRAAARLIPQDDDPVIGEQGALLFNDARSATGKLRLFTTQWESVHSSDKGHVYAPGLSQSGSLLVGASVDLSLAQISPEEVGRVVVTVTGHLDWSADGASTTVQIRDVDAAATINGGGVGVIEYPIVGALGRDHSFVARINYTLPDATTRTFSVRLTSAGGTTTYTDVTVTVEGVT